MSIQRSKHKHWTNSNHESQNCIKGGKRKQAKAKRTPLLRLRPRFSDYPDRDLASRLIYLFFLRLITTFEMLPTGREVDIDPITSIDEPNILASFPTDGEGLGAALKA